METEGVGALNEMMDHAEQKRLIERVLIPVYHYLQQERNIYSDVSEHDPLLVVRSYEISPTIFDSYDFAAEYDSATEQLYFTIGQEQKDISDSQYTEFDRREYRIGQRDGVLTTKLLHSMAINSTGVETSWTLGVHTNESVAFIDDDSMLDRDRTELEAIERSFSKASQTDLANVHLILGEMGL